MRFRPLVETRGDRYYARLNVDGFNAEAVDEITCEFDSREKALTDLVRRLRHMFQAGDCIEIRGTLYRDLAVAEIELRTGPR